MLTVNSRERRSALGKGRRNRRNRPEWKTFKWKNTPISNYRCITNHIGREIILAIFLLIWPSSLR
jgi:hypothetical protein